MSKDNQADANSLELALLKVVRGFSSSPEGGAFFLKYILLPNTESNNQLVSTLYKNIIDQFDTQKELANDIVLSLQHLREQSLVDENVKLYLEQQIENIINYKDLVDYSNDIPKDKFLDITV